MLAVGRHPGSMKPVIAWLERRVLAGKERIQQVRPPVAYGPSRARVRESLITCNKAIHLVVMYYN